MPRPAPGRRRPAQDAPPAQLDAPPPPARLALLALALAALAFLGPADAAPNKTISVPVGGAWQLQDKTAGVIMAAAFRLAVAEVNNQTAILPNIRLVEYLADQGSDNNAATSSVLKLAGSGAMFVVGLRTSKAAEPMSYVLNGFKVPHASISASAPSFSVKKDFPYYGRMVPSDAYQGAALARLAYSSYGWKRCAIVSTTDAYGSGIQGAFIAEAKKIGLQVLAAPTFFSGVAASSLASVASVLKSSDARVFVCAMLHADVAALLAAAVPAGLVGDDFAWLFSDSVVADSSLVGKSETVLKAMKGAVGMRPYGGGASTPEYVALLNTWATLDPAVYAGSGVRSITYYGPFAYDAVWAYARAMDAMAKDGYDFSNYNFTGAPGTTNYLGPALNDYFTKVNFPGTTGRVQFTPEGDRVGVYEVMNIKALPASWSVIGMYDGAAFSPAQPPALWFNGLSTPPQDTAARCDAGFYSDAVRGCLPCSPGTYAPAHSTACIPCPAGYFSTDAMASSCTPCPAGWFQDRTGQTSCVECDITSYAPYSNMTLCNKCPGFSQTGRQRSTALEECRCREDYYALRPFTGAKAETCLACPNGAYCAGPVPPVALNDFYRIPWSVGGKETPSYERCRADGSCVGGNSSACAPGYAGLLCAQCAVGFGQSRPFNCNKCFPTAAIYTIVTIGLICVVGILAFITISAVNTALKPESKHSVMLKILLSYLQVTAFGQAFELGWPALLEQFFDISSTAAAPVAMIVSLDCLSSNDGGFGFYRQYVIYLCIPFLCIVFAALAYLLAFFKHSILRLFGRRTKKGPKPAAPEAASPSSSSTALVQRSDSNDSTSVGVAAAEGQAAAAVYNIVDAPQGGVAIRTAGGATHELVPAGPAASSGGPGPKPGVKAVVGRRTSSGAVVPALSGLAAVVAEGTAQQRKKKKTASIGAGVPEDDGPRRKKSDEEAAKQKGGWTIRDKTYVATPTDYALVSLVVCLYTIQPAVAQIILNAFACVEVGGRRFLRQDLGQACSGPDWDRYTIGIGIPGILVYIWILPLLPFAILYFKRKQLERPHLRVRFAFLCRGFREQYVWFEAFNLVKKQLVIFIAVFLSQKIMVQGLLALGLLVVANVYLAKAQPYEHRELNLLDVIQSTVVSLTVFGGLFFGTASLDEGQNAIIAIVLLVINFAFLGLWVWLFVKEMLRIAKSQKHIGAAISYVALATARFKERAKSQITSMLSSPPMSRTASAAAMGGPSARVAPAPEPRPTSLNIDTEVRVSPNRIKPASGTLLALSGADLETEGKSSSPGSAVKASPKVPSAARKYAPGEAGPPAPEFATLASHDADEDAAAAPAPPAAADDVVVPFPSGPPPSWAASATAAGGPAGRAHRGRHEAALEEEEA